MSRSPDAAEPTDVPPIDLAPIDVALLDVTEAVLKRLLAVAQDDADADEVTPPGAGLRAGMRTASDGSAHTIAPRQPGWTARPGRKPGR